MFGDLQAICVIMTDEKPKGIGQDASRVESCDFDAKDLSEDTVDPRVQVELERLNAATDLINKLEIELDEARSNFRLLLSESSQRVNYLARKLGACVEKARPYYEARMYAKQLQARTQKAAQRYEKATSAHCAAKEMVYLAEEGLKKEGRCFDPAWQEMLNHATMRVNEAESERVLSQQDHQQTSFAYNEAEKNVQQLHQDVKRAIAKSSLSTRRCLLQLNNLANQHQLQLLPYFEMKAHFNQLLEEQRKKVHHLEENVLKVKLSYADALHNLEEISDEIHQKRQIVDKEITSPRGEGVGEESPSVTWNGVRMPYQQFLKRNSSTEDVYSSSFDVEETYKSLPRKLNSRASTAADGSVENSYESAKTWKSPRQACDGYDSCNSVCSFVLGDSNTNVTKVTKESASKIKEASPYSHDEGSHIANMTDELQCLSVSNENYTHHPLTESNKKPVENCDASHDQKHYAVDLNILRVQKDELSDSESLASNDTADTLDDNQIECLFLDRGFPIEYNDMLPSTESENPGNS